MPTFIDIETRSTADLRKVGAHPYAKHPTTGIWCVCYATGDESVKVWYPCREPAPKDFLWALDNDILIAHNAAFERAVLSAYLNVELPVDRWICTMAEAYAMALPGGLDDLAHALGLEETKDKKGHALMMRMARPRKVHKDGTIEWWDDLARVMRLTEYCVQDVEVTRECYRRLSRLIPSERHLWEVDQYINDRGVYVDRESATLASEICKVEKKRLNRAMLHASGGVVKTTNANKDLSAWLTRTGQPVTECDKQAVDSLLASTSIGPQTRRMLELRQEASYSSVAKLDTLLRCTADDDPRLRGLFQYHAASTGRWGGRKFQPQNIPRPTISQASIEAIIEQLPNADAIDRIDMLTGAAIPALSNCLRAMLTAPPGKMLCGIDYSAIEARVLAWMAGEQWVIEVFRRGGKIYEEAAAKIFGVSVDAVTKEQRQIGKTSELACGFGGGDAAILRFADTFGIEISPDFASEIKTAWRRSHPMIVKFWHNLERAAKLAIENPGQPYTVSSCVFSMIYVDTYQYLSIELASGRRLLYANPRVESGSIVFDGVGFNRKWQTINTYGGKLSENVVSATARDLLAASLVEAHQEGLDIVLHVHDEIVIESAQPEEDYRALEAIMLNPPRWADGLPVAVDGWIGKRYRK